MNPNAIGRFGAARREMELEWQMLRDLRGGTTTMRAAGSRWLVPDSEERRRLARFEERLRRSVLYPAYDEAVSKTAAVPFQRPVQIAGEIDWPLDRIENNADRQGTSLTRFAWQLLDDMADRGMAMFIVDNVPTDRTDEAGVTRRMNLAEAEREDARPYFARINPDNLLGHTVELRNGKDVITELRVREWSIAVDKDGNETLRTRVRRWTETDFEVWEQNQQATELANLTGREGAGAYTLVEGPTPHGFPNGIPLVVVYANKLGALYSRPPLLGLAWENVGHWNARSAKDWVLHQACAPLLVVTNVSHQTAEAPPVVGAGAALVDSGDAKVFYVEPSGASIQAAERNLESIERRMQAMALGPRVEGVFGPATATGEIRADKAANCLLNAWIEALEWGLYDAYGMAATWIGERLPEDFDVAIYREPALIAGAAQDMAMLQADAREGRITQRTYLTEMCRRGLFAGLDIEAEIELTATGPEPLDDEHDDADDDDVGGRAA